MLARQQQVYYQTLGTNVDPYNPASQAMLERLRGGFLSSGADPVTASHQALAAVAGLVHRQAAIVSFVEIFRLLGIMFLSLIPLVFLMKRPAGRGGPAAAH